MLLYLVPLCLSYTTRPRGVTLVHQVPFSFMLASFVASGAVVSSGQLDPPEACSSPQVSALHCDFRVDTITESPVSALSITRC